MIEQWQQISVTVPEEAADVVSNTLIELGSQGTVFETPENEPKQCRIIGYYPVSPETNMIVDHITQFLNALPQYGFELDTIPRIDSSLLDNVDWSTNWKHHFKPARIGQHLIVKPSWEAYTAQAGDVIIEIDPGMAFGSGLHPSTRLVMTFLEQYLRPESDVFDVGTGSGILSMTAACLGASYVLGVDIDPEAIAVARDNVRHNTAAYQRTPPINERIELKTGSLDTLEIDRQFDCILMNIRPNIILPLTPYIAPYLRTGGALVISGILEEEGPDLIEQIHRQGFLIQNRAVEEGWIAYVLSLIHV